MRRSVSYILALILLLALGCAEQGNESESSRLTAASYLAAGDTSGYKLALEPRQFSFPDDHGPHPGFRNEWWYLTGNLETETGSRFGYQVTFFANALRPTEEHLCNGNQWCTDYVWMGHAAISDIENREHYAAEIFSREAPGLAGAISDPYRIWIQDWQLFSPHRDLPWGLEVTSEDFAITLQLNSSKAPVLQGVDGLSQKSEAPGNASFYYSLSRMETNGQLSIGGHTLTVTGSSWMDREWSTSALSSNQSGWDWFSLQFHDGSELMYYQLRDLEGRAHPFSAGKYMSISGINTSINSEDIALVEEHDWTASNGVIYTTQWRMGYRGHDLLIKAYFEEQLMDLTFEYWEGAVEVLDYQSGAELGKGYLEMVRN